MAVPNAALLKNRIFLAFPVAELVAGVPGRVSSLRPRASARTGSATRKLTHGTRLVTDLPWFSCTLTNRRRGKLVRLRGNHNRVGRLSRGGRSDGRLGLGQLHSFDACTSSAS
jgi:hypothetical protein